MRPRLSEAEWEQVSALEARLQPLSDEARLAEFEQLRRDSEYSARIIEIAAGRFKLPLEDERGPAVRQVGSSILGERLDAGGMGEIYRAWQDVGGDQREVAVKFIHPNLDMELGDQAKARFMREVATLAKLEYRGIVRLYEGGEAINPGTQETALFLTMQLVRNGMPMTAYASTHDLNTLERLILFRNVCNAVLYAHNHDVLHRDLKPDNILVDTGGEAYIIDFGLAQTFEEMVPSQTFEMVSGTSDYMSPEQLLGGLGQPGKPSDVYALGVILYELLTGEFPFCRPSDVPQNEMGRLILNRAVPPLKQNLKDPSKGLENIVVKALKTDPKQRFAGVDPLLTAVDREIDQPIASRRPWVLVLSVPLAPRPDRRPRSRFDPPTAASHDLTVNPGFAAGQALAVVTGCEAAQALTAGTGKTPRI